MANLENAVLDRLAPLRDRFLSLEDGGREVGFKEDRRKKYRVAKRRLLIKVDALELVKELAELCLCVKNSEDEEVEFDFRQPCFKEKKEEVDVAYTEAIADARAKADVVAKASGVKIAGVQNARQLALKERSSGAFGDSDWWGDADRFAPITHVGGSGGGPKISDPTRTIFVRFLVRFSVS